MGAYRGNADKVMKDADKIRVSMRISYALQGHLLANIKAGVQANRLQKNDSGKHWDAIQERATFVE